MEKLTLVIDPVFVVQNDKAKNLSSILCNHCNSLLRDPQQLVNCGHLFCRECVRLLMTQDKPCSGCGHDCVDGTMISGTTISVPDTRANYEVINITVICSSCLEWRGRAASLAAHLKVCKPISAQLNPALAVPRELSAPVFIWMRNLEVYSPSFYTGRDGYRVFMHLYNGSVTVRKLPGELDGFLPSVSPQFKVEAMTRGGKRVGGITRWDIPLSLDTEELAVIRCESIHHQPD
jgi:hypothetical protein